MGFGGALCRALLFAAAGEGGGGAGGGRAALVVELGAPAAAATDGVALCAPAGGEDGALRLAPGAGWELARVEEGGTQFDARALASAGVAFLAAEAEAASVAPLEGASVYDLLATDPYYASSYHSARYDDLRADAQGRGLRGFFGDAGDADAASPVAPAGSAAEDARVANGSCVLVTGPFRAGERYALTFVADASDVAVDPGALPELWYLPMSYDDDGAGGLRLDVRGDKRGTVCEARSGVATEQVPPAATPTLSLGLEGEACAAGQARASLRYGGECVECESVSGVVSGSLAEGTQRCDCPADVHVVPVGGAACGAQWVEGDADGDAPVTNAAQLAANLCARLAAELAAIEAGTGSDAVAASGAALNLLRDDGTALLDETTIAAAEAAVDAEMAPDPRQRGDPIRRTGLRANCEGCGTQDGSFTDASSGQSSHYVDTRYEAARAMRIAGVAMELAGYPCADDALSRGDVDDAVRHGDGLCSIE